MGRDPDTPFEVDPLAATDFEMPHVKRAYAMAIESRPERRLARLQVKKAERDRRLSLATPVARDAALRYSKHQYSRPMEI